MFGRNFVVLIILASLHGSEAAADDAAAFKAVCAGCHPAATVLVRRIKGATEEERRAWLAALLANHHAPDEATASQVTAYLLALPVK